MRPFTMRFLAGAASFHLLLLSASAFAAPKIKFTETVLGKRPPLATPRMGFSPDGTRVAWAARDGAKERIEINGTAVYTAEKTDRIFFTPDSRHSIVLERRGPKWVVAFDGRAGSEFDRVQNFVFSPAGDRLAYVGIRGTRQVPVVDGIEWPEHDSVFGLIWGGDGRVLFAGYDGGSAQLFIDRAASGQIYKRMSPPVLSDDGRNIATAVVRPNDRELVVVNGTEGSDHLKALNVAMTRDGKHTAYVGLDQLARVYVDETPGAAHPSVGPVVFSPDGRRVAYIASTEDNKLVVVVDGVAQTPHVNVDGLQFSPDSKHVVYFAADPSRSVVVIDSVEAGPFGQLIPKAIYSADGGRWAAVTKVNARQAVILDGVRGKLYDSVDEPAFSTDGRLVAYGAIRNGRTILVVNGTEFKQYKSRVGGPPRFVGNRLLRFLVLRGDEVVRVDAEVTP